MSLSPRRRPLKAKKDIDEDIISEKFTFQIKDWKNQSERCGIEITTECTLCDIDWLVTFRASDFHSEYASIHITNLSNRSITASYIFTLKNHQELRDVVFVDPEESVTFDPDGGGDDTWGSDDFILSSELMDAQHGFIHNDSLIIEIETQICGVVKSSATLLSQAIENSTEVEDLLSLADLDINPFRMKYLVSTSDILISQENSLVSSRLSTSVVDTAGQSQRGKRNATSTMGRKR